MTTRATMRVLESGPLTTVQDLGRAGLAHLGVGHSGACDQPAIRLANRIVGNRESAAALEVTIGGLALRFSHSTWVAFTGARAPLTVDGRAESFFGPVFAPAGGELRMGLSKEGMRSYLAVRGGVDVPPVLGSRSTDLLTSIGPLTLRAGDVVVVGDELDGTVAGIDLIPTRPIESEPVLELVLGPRPEWFAADALEKMVGATWEVSPDSNRIGVWLIGPSIGRAHLEELPSEGLVAGAIQVPPSGQPVLFLADHPVTGGYPVIAILRHASLPAAAQLRLGQRLHFRLR